MLVFILLVVVIVSAIAWVAGLALGPVWPNIPFLVLVASLFLFRVLLLYLGSDARRRRGEPKSALLRVLFYNPFRDWESGGGDEEVDAPPPHVPRCPVCGSGNIESREDGPGPTGPGGGLFSRPLKALARWAGTGPGNRVCRDCGHRW